MNNKRGIIVAGNWKMNQGLKDTEKFFRSFNTQAKKALSSKDKALIKKNKLQICISPCCLSLQKAQSLASKFDFPITISAQNAWGETMGAYTGEVSAPMLQEIGVEWALVGHSERRHVFKESDDLIRRRATGLLAQGFHVILCIGETLEERNLFKTNQVLTRQIQESIPERCPSLPSRLILAYEPVWAIGTGHNATPKQAEEAHQFIRGLLLKNYGEKFSKEMRILYGGSVTPQNVEALLDCRNVDGVLVGGASLDSRSFLKLIQAGLKLLKV